MTRHVIVIAVLLAGAVSTGTVQKRLLAAENSRPKIKCGDPVHPIDITSSRKRVVGGLPTTTKSVPWAVMIKKYGEPGVQCGGAILSHRLVLTAAHCFNHMDKNDMYMFVGKDEVDYYNVNQNEYHAQNVVIHEHYNSTTSENDIALVKTSTKIVFNSNVAPVCLPESGQQLSDGQQCLFAGYGDTEGTGFDRRLNYAQMPVVNDSLCARPDWLGREYDVLRNVSICAGYADGGPDACMGDSGGALVCKHQNEENFYVHGISSWGKGCGERHKPGVYTRVASFVDWILEHWNYMQ